MTEHLFSLAGRRVIVTGGTRGIGRAISLHFARAGAHVIANYHADDAAAESLRKELDANGLSVTTCRADVASPEGRARLLEDAGVETLSALVHCAATGVHRTLPELTGRHWDFTFALNVRALFELVKAVLPRLASGSSIIGLSSAGAVQAFPHYSVVGASKGALEALCRHMAVELAPNGIRVNVLSAGTVVTQALDAFPDREAQIADAIARSPRRRLTTADEVAHVAHFLCCDASSGVSGHTLVVDGGQRVRG